MSTRPYVYAGIAAAAMVATLPGRTHGLGLITEPLLVDLSLDRVAYASINFWATLIGAAFCFPCGWLIDRIGVRAMLSFTTISLGIVVIAMAHLQPGSATLGLPDFDALVAGRYAVLPVPLDLFALILLTRGLGQSALSVVSLALIGKVAKGKAGPIMGVYSFATAVGFMAAFAIIKFAFEKFNVDWRTVWQGIGIAVVVAGILAACFVKNPMPETDSQGVAKSITGTTLGRALLSPIFWVFALATSLYGLIAAGISLFNQSILSERGFDTSVFLTITMLGPIVGLCANLITGWLAGRIRLGLLLAAAMAIMAGSLFWFPHVRSLVEVYTYAAAMGIAGGMITVLFFTVWGQAFGQRHLGSIQGAAQLLTVLASAAGPLMMALAKRNSASYLPLFSGLAWVSLGFAVVSLFVKIPGSQGENK